MWGFCKIHNLWALGLLEGGNKRLYRKSEGISVYIEGSMFQLGMLFFTKIIYSLLSTNKIFIPVKIGNKTNPFI